MRSPTRWNAVQDRRRAARSALDRPGAEGSKSKRTRDQPRPGRGTARFCLAAWRTAWLAPTAERQASDRAGEYVARLSGSVPRVVACRGPFEFSRLHDVDGIHNGLPGEGLE